jgi:hypothetical protein
MSSHNYEETFLKQIYDSQVRLESALEGMLQIIFNLYDDDGDGILTYEDYISFISDLLLISTFMNRMKTEEYNYENVLRVARWSSSNFTSNLFREPQKNITYEVFLQGIMHAVTEHKDMPILGRKLYFTSLMPEIMNFFHFYDKLAKRRGWPTVQINETHNIFEENGEPVENREPDQLPQELPFVENVIEEPPQKEEKEEIQQPNITAEQIAKEVETQEQQIREYQERRQQQFRQQQEIRQREQQRVQMELLQQRQQQFQQQFRQNIESRQQEQINAGEELRRLHEEQQQQYVDRRMHDQFGDEEPDMPREYKLEDAGIIEISKDEQGFDPIEGDVNVVDFINQNTKDNIVFKFGGRFYLVDKSRLHAMSSLNLKDNSVFYGCMCEIESDWTNPQTWALLNHVVILDPIYFNVQHLGLPIRYVNLNNIRGIIHPNAEHNYYVIEKPEDYIVVPSFASDNILKHGIGSMSGIHCQSGQEDTIYVIKKFTPKIV